MYENDVEFLSLDSSYQDLLRIAQERYGITIDLLQKLSGGRSGALLYLISISSIDGQELSILKLEHLAMRSDTIQSEADRHRIVLGKAPQEFAEKHMAKLAFDPIVSGDRTAIFYEIAGRSLQQYRPITSYHQQSQLETIFCTVYRGLLTEWNTGIRFEKVDHPQQLLEGWLGYRIHSIEGNIEHHLKTACHLIPTASTLLLEDPVGSPPLPNPLAYARDQTLWKPPRAIFAPVGFLHGDLNQSNVLVGFERSGEKLEQYYLIDFANFQEHGYLLYDQVYLEMSYLIELMPRVPFEKWVRFISVLAENDLPEQGIVPTELAGASAVVADARKSFDDWARNSSSGMYDDL